MGLGVTDWAVAVTSLGAEGCQVDVARQLCIQAWHFRLRPGLVEIHRSSVLGGALNAGVVTEAQERRGCNKKTGRPGWSPEEAAWGQEKQRELEGSGAPQWAGWRCLRNAPFLPPQIPPRPGTPDAGTAGKRCPCPSTRPCLCLALNLALPLPRCSGRCLLALAGWGVRALVSPEHICAGRGGWPCPRAATCSGPERLLGWEVGPAP